MTARVKFATRYTDEDDGVIIISLRRNKSNNEIGKLLGRSEKSIENRLRDLRQMGTLPTLSRGRPNVKDPLTTDCPVLSEMQTVKQSHAYIEALREHHGELEIRLRTVGALVRA